MDLGAGGAFGFVGGRAQILVHFFERAVEADEEGRTAVRGTAVTTEIAGSELAVAGDDGAAHGTVFVGALRPRLIVR